MTIGSAFDNLDCESSTMRKSNITSIRSRAVRDARAPVHDEELHSESVCQCARQSHLESINTSQLTPSTGVWTFLWRLICRSRGSPRAWRKSRIGGASRLIDAHAG